MGQDLDHQVERESAHEELAVLETAVLKRRRRAGGLHIDRRLIRSRPVVVAAVVVAAATAGAGLYIHSRSQTDPTHVIAFLPGQQIAQSSPVQGRGPWTYGGQWMFNYTGEPVTLDRVTLLGITPGFRVTRISIALDRKQNGMVGSGYPPTWAPHPRPVNGTVVPSLGLRQVANVSQTAEILVGFTLDPTKRVAGFRGMRIEYTQGGHHDTYVLHAAFSACPHIPPRTWRQAENACGDMLSPLS